MVDDQRCLVCVWLEIVVKMLEVKVYLFVFIISCVGCKSISCVKVVFSDFLKV